MDSTSLRVGQSLPGVPDAIMGFDVEQQAALLVEYHADTEEELAGLRSAGQSLLDASALRAPAILSPDAKNRQAAWKFRKGLYASVAGAPAFRVPPRCWKTSSSRLKILAETCDSLQELFHRVRLRGFGDLRPRQGRQHPLHAHRPLRGRCGAEPLQLLQRQDGAAYQILDKDGNLKAEHGTGRAMAPFVRAASTAISSTRCTWN